MFLSELIENESISTTLGCIPYHNIVPVNHSLNTELLRDVLQSLASLDIEITKDYYQIELSKVKQ